MKAPITLISASGSLRLTKRFTTTGVEPYPNARNVSSIHYETDVSPEGLRGRFELLRENARYGHALLRGSLKRPLENESRAGLTNRDALAHTVMVDVDGWDVGSLSLDQRPLDRSHVLAVAETILQQLPEYMQQSSYIASASSSFGIKNKKASVHIEFMLDEPVHPRAIKDWLRAINLDSPKVEEQLSLTKNGHQIAWVIDPSVADNSKLIYISNPAFDEGVDDPFGGASDERWVLVEKQVPLLPLARYAGAVDANKVQGDATAKIRALRKVAGLRTENARTQQILSYDLETGQEVRQSVITNPASCRVQLFRTTDKFAIFNIDGGDSNAYWARLEQPDIIYNFKGETPFLFSRADPEGYEAFLTDHATLIEEHTTGELVCFRDEPTDTFYYGVYDKKKDTFPRNSTNVRELYQVSRNNLDEALASRGGVPPEVVPSVTLHFDPTISTVWDRQNRVINTFEAPPIMREPVSIPEEFTGLRYDPDLKGENGIGAYVQALCPNIYRVLWHVIGNDDECFEHFINWLAFCLQRREVSNTAWVFSGVPGTGKGLLMSHIIKPIWAEYAAQKEQKNLEDNFNGGLDRLLMCGIDEVSMSDSRNQSRLLDNIKHLIGSSMGTIRAMRSDQKEARYFCNYLLFSNHAGAVRIEPGDRRFNVSPSQNVALDKVYPQIKKEADLMLGEVAAFASLLAHFDYDLFAARTTLENEAKLGMRLAAGSAHDQFFDAVRSFNLDYFVDNVLLQRGDGDDFKEIQRISTAKTVVQSWVRDAEAGTLSFVPLDDIRAVYISMFPAAHVAPTKFGSMARKQNLQTVRKTLPCGTKPRCVEAAWTLSEHAGFESNTAPPIAPETRPATTLH